MQVLEKNETVSNQKNEQKYPPTIVASNLTARKEGGPTVVWGGVIRSHGNDNEGFVLGVTEGGVVTEKSKVDLTDPAAGCAFQEAVGGRVLGVHGQLCVRVGAPEGIRVHGEHRVHPGQETGDVLGQAAARFGPQ